jgi:ABC-type multidrug transport system fused ATPase/permease subunit
MKTKAAKHLSIMNYLKFQKLNAFLFVLLNFLGNACDVVGTFFIAAALVEVTKLTNGSGVVDYNKFILFVAITGSLKVLEKVFARSGAYVFDILKMKLKLKLRMDLTNKIGKVSSNIFTEKGSGVFI